MYYYTGEEIDQRPPLQPSSEWGPPGSPRPLARGSGTPGNLSIFDRGTTRGVPEPDPDRDFGDPLPCVVSKNGIVCVLWQVISWTRSSRRTFARCARLIDPAAFACISLLALQHQKCVFFFFFPRQEWYFFLKKKVTANTLCRQVYVCS